MGMHLEHLGSRLLEDMPDALIVADADGIIRFWNDGAERIFGSLPPRPSADRST